MTPTPPLREIVIVASSGCNQHCSYCWIRGHAEMSPPWPTVAAAADKLLASPLRSVWVSFTGGEPLQAFPLVRTTVEYISSHRRADKRVRYKLLTNGLLLDREILCFLAKHRFDVQVSLDGSRGVNDRRSPRSFDLLADLFATLRRGCPRYLARHVSIAATVTPETVGRLADSVSQLMASGAGTISINAAMGVGTRHVSMADLNGQLERIAHTVLLHYGRTQHVPFAPFRKGISRGRTPERGPWFCAAPTNRSLTIDADGTSAACLMATRTYAPAPPRVLQPAVNALRRLHLNEPISDENGVAGLGVFRSRVRRYSSWGSCENCRWKHDCRICPLSAVMEHDWADSLRIPDFLCEFNRALFEQRDRFPPQRTPTP